eukprot:6204032-Pleurochrysis_carterae.AAC.2
MRTHTPTHSERPFASARSGGAPFAAKSQSGKTRLISCSFASFSGGARHERDASATRPRRAAQCGAAAAAAGEHTHARRSVQSATAHATASGEAASAPAPLLPAAGPPACEKTRTSGRRFSTCMMRRESAFKARRCVIETASSEISASVLASLTPRLLALDAANSVDVDAAAVAAALYVGAAA